MEQVPGMVHDHVVHKKKKVKGKDGKHRWLKPRYTKVFQHALPGGRKLKVMGGTQIIDRAWKFMRKYLQNRSFKVGSTSLRYRLRSAQWVYWMRDQDLWKKTGDMLKTMPLASGR